MCGPDVRRYAAVVGSAGRGALRRLFWKAGLREGNDGSRTDASSVVSSQAAALADCLAEERERMVDDAENGHRSARRGLRVSSAYAESGNNLNLKLKLEAKRVSRRC